MKTFPKKVLAWLPTNNCYGSFMTGGFKDSGNWVLFPINGQYLFDHQEIIPIKGKKISTDVYELKEVK